MVQWLRLTLLPVREDLGLISDQELDPTASTESSHATTKRSHMPQLKRSHVLQQDEDLVCFSENSMQPKEINNILKVLNRRRSISVM